jgi:DNA-binding helix-hairpin-helix protein with protein kinase domain
MILRRVSDGSRISLGRALGSGGEGTVYEVSGDSLVAKIYHKPPAPPKIEKLGVMVRAGTPALLRVAAWPVELLEDEARRVRGFLMPRADARENAHQLYSPKSRRHAFPDADFRFVVHAAANVARAFASMHAAGHVIGDVNHGNALIGHDATVVLIDCDSFQVRDPAGRVFTCDVGVPLFTAPELQNMPFRGLERSERHDSFGLAVLMFHLLFQGRHPYAGVCAEGEMPIERAIAESRFAYGAASAQRGMSPPPATLPLDAFGARIAGLFEQAFAPPGETPRPRADEWIEALTALERELVPCAASPAHFHPGGDCCWCAVERQSGLRLFGPIIAGEEASEGVLDSLWNAIKAVPRPALDPTFAPALKLPPKLPRWMRWMPWSRQTSLPRFLFGSAVAIAVLGLASLLSAQLFAFTLMACVTVYAVEQVWGGRRLLALQKRNVRRGQDLANAQWQWKRLVAAWNRECSTAVFNEQLEKLNLAREELRSWSGMRQRELRALRRDVATRARELFLERKRLDRANLSLRREDIAALASLGIETAADVVRESRKIVHALASASAHEVQAWATGHSRSFVFDKNAPSDPELLAQVEARLAARRQELVATLRNGPEILELKRLQIDSARKQLEPAMNSAWAELRAAREAASE